MKKYKYLFYDFDGTICNTYEGIVEILDLTFEHYGVSVDSAIYTKFIGPPLSDTFAKYIGKDVAYEAVNFFKQNYADRNAILKTKLYDGIAETFEALKKHGFHVCIASCKKQDEAETLLQHFNIEKSIDFVSGLWYNIREKKAEILDYAVKTLGADIKDCVMIGDTCYDADGAQALGMDCIMCLWGFGEYELIKNENIVFSAKNAYELADELINA